MRESAFLTHSHTKEDTDFSEETDSEEPTDKATVERLRHTQRQGTRAFHVS